MSAIPIILCGRNPPLAQAVRKHLLPEFNVIHIISSPSSGIHDLPSLLSPSSDRPVAVIVGGGFDDEMFDSMRNACMEEGVKDVPWARADLSRAGEMPDYKDVEAFGKKTAERAKVRLGELRVGRGGGEMEGVFWY